MDIEAILTKNHGQQTVDARMSLRQAVQLCAQHLCDIGLVLNEEMIVPFSFRNCMIFLSKPDGQLQVDVAVSQPVQMDHAIQSMHLNTRFVMNEMVAQAISLYGAEGDQAFAMSFLFRDGCGLVKFGQDKAYLVELIERMPLSFDHQVVFAEIEE